MQLESRDIFRKKAISRMPARHDQAIEHQPFRSFIASNDIQKANILAEKRSILNFE